MRKIRIISLVTIFIAAVLITAGYSIMLVDDYKLDMKKTNAAISLIKNSYVSYSNDLEDIALDIKNTTVFNLKYYSDIKKNYDASIKELSNIEKNIRNIETTTNTLRYECNNRDYNDYDIDNKCMTIDHNYETIVNAYVSLIDKYNQKIKVYNDWDGSKKDLKEFESEYYKDYVDVDNDGDFLGIIK